MIKITNVEEQAEQAKKDAEAKMADMLEMEEYEPPEDFAVDIWKLTQFDDKQSVSNDESEIEKMEKEVDSITAGYPY